MPKNLDKKGRKTLYSTRHQKRKQVTKVLRDIDVLDLRELGWSYERIADHMTRHGQEMSAGTAAEIVKRLISNVLENSKEKIEHVRELELRKLDKLEATTNEILNNKRNKAFIRLQAEDRILKIQMQRARLTGLEIKPEISVKHQGEVAVRVYHGIEPPPELVQLEASNPVEADFEMLEEGRGNDKTALDSASAGDPGSTPQCPV